MKKKLSVKIIILSYILFLFGWIIRVVFVDFSGLSEYASWLLSFLIHTIWWPMYGYQGE